MVGDQGSDVAGRDQDFDSAFAGGGAKGPEAVGSAVGVDHLKGVGNAHHAQCLQSAAHDVKVRPAADDDSNEWLLHGFGVSLVGQFPGSQLGGDWPEGLDFKMQHARFGGSSKNPGQSGQIHGRQCLVQALLLAHHLGKAPATALLHQR
jgi:hypothetical protein